MFTPMALPVFLVLVVIGVPVVCGTLIALAAILKGGGTKKRERVEADESRLIQELHQGMNRLEARIEAIETILMDRELHKEKLQ